MQTTGITISLKNKEINIYVAYCPPGYNINKELFVRAFRRLGESYIIAEDFKAKHTRWDSRKILPKEKELLKAIPHENCEIHSMKKPAYWPTDLKIPGLLDFFITKDVPVNNIFMKDITDLSSDHTSIRKEIKQTLTNKKTSWDLFTEILNEKTNLKVSLKNTAESESAAAGFIDILQEAAKDATPVINSQPPREI